MSALAVPVDGAVVTALLVLPGNDDVGESAEAPWKDLAVTGEIEGAAPGRRGGVRDA